MEKKASAAPVRKAASLPGTFDVITSQDTAWRMILASYERYAGQYGFTRVELPIVEDPSLFSTVYGQGDECVTQLLAPEVGGHAVGVRSGLLPSLLRSLVQQKHAEPHLTKWMYDGMSVRTGPKQVQSDFEFGFEVWGPFNHLTEAQVLGAAWQMFSSLGLADVTFEVNTCGNTASQENYIGSLREFLKTKRYGLCDSCADHITDNPIAVLRCQKLDCQSELSDAPTILDFLDEAARKQFTNLLEALEELQIPYQLSPLLAGIDGATGTVASLKLKMDGRVTVVAEAEGHTGLLARLGGKNIQAFGLRGSFDLLRKVLLERGLAEAAVVKRPAEVYLVPLGELAAKRSLRLFRDLVEAGVTVFDYFGYAGVKNQLKAAQEAGSPIALIMGQKEAVDEVVILRDVKSGMQEVFSYDKIVEEVKKRLGR
jgi:histidyl-tRNA synthetase